MNRKHCDSIVIVDGDYHYRKKVVGPEEITKLKNKILELRTEVSELKGALNETREQVQTLLDYCFTDRSRWKEGQANIVKEVKQEEKEIKQEEKEVKQDEKEFETGSSKQKSEQ